MTRGLGRYVEGLDPEEQYHLIRELLAPEFGNLYVTPPDMDERIPESELYHFRSHP